MKFWQPLPETPGNFSRGAVIPVFLSVLLVTLAGVLLVAKKPWHFPHLDSVEDFASVFSWWAGLINLVSLTVLLATSRWWRQRLPAPLPLSKVPPSFQGFRLLVLGAMAVCAITAAFRLNDSLWGDELYSVRQYVLGGYKVSGDGTVKPREVRWSRTLWYYEKPTNHIFQTILSRLSLSAWRSVVRPAGLQINETAVRLPSYLGGILSVGTLALLLARVGLPGSGVLAAWLLALHPWHLRLIAEARGYGLVMFFMPLICLLAIRALETGGWGRWMALAAAEFALLYTWPGAIPIVGILNLCIGFCLLRGERFRAARPVLVMRWLVSQAVAGMAFLQLFLPCIPQVVPYMEGAFGFFSHPFWLKNVGGLLFMGSPWSKTLRVDSPYVEGLPFAANHPFFFGFSLAFAAAFFLLGVLRLCGKKVSVRWLPAVLILPGPIIYAGAALKDKYLYEWYVSFLLPGIAAAVAAGALWPLVYWKARPVWCGVYAAALLSVFLILTQPARAFLLTRSAQASREAVLLTRPTLDPNAPENRTIITAATTQTLDTYDPRTRRAGNLEQYAALMQEADDRGVPLFVNNGYMGSMRIKFPAVAALLEDEAIFEPVRILTGFEEMLDRAVFRYRPGSLKQADFDRYRQAQPPPGIRNLRESY